MQLKPKRIHRQDAKDAKSGADRNDMGHRVRCRWFDFCFFALLASWRFNSSNIQKAGSATQPDRGSRSSGKAVVRSVRDDRIIDGRTIAARRQCCSRRRALDPICSSPPNDSAVNGSVEIRLNVFLPRSCLLRAARSSLLFCRSVSMAGAARGGASGASAGLRAEVERQSEAGKRRVGDPAYKDGSAPPSGIIHHQAENLTRRMITKAPRGREFLFFVPWCLGG